MMKENDLLNEYFNYYDEIFQSIKFFEYPLIYAKYQNIRQEYTEVINEVNQHNFLSTMGCILDLDAKLQILIELLVYYKSEDEKERCDEEEILKCSSSDYKFYYLEQFGYRLNDKKPHTILHFFM